MQLANRNPLRNNFGPVCRFFILLFGIGLLQPGIAARAQEGVFIPAHGSVFAYPSDTISIFSDVVNNGSLGSAKSAVINFFGKTWINAVDADLPDESSRGDKGTGGSFRFLSSPLASNGPQELYSGYNANTDVGPGFPNLSIANRQGVYLGNLNDLKVRNNLNFEAGHLYLNGWSVVVGNQGTGSITGYSDQQFIVTGSSIAGGYLYREQLSNPDSLVVFPVGTTDNSYSPGAIRYTNPPPSGFRVRVFDHVYDKALSGIINDQDYVMKTWDIGTNDETPVSGGMQLVLQHDAQDEGARFTPYRDSSYISRYDGNGWDILSPGGTVSPGTLTTGAISANSYMNTRPVPASGVHSYYSVSTLGYSNTACASAVFALLKGSRFSARYVELFWRTSYEENVTGYIVERRRDKDSVFTPVATIPSRSPNGYSQPGQLSYYYDSDDNYYDGWTYYRIKIIGAGGCFKYSDIIQVPWMMQIKIWPNPNQGHFTADIFGVPHPVQMNLTDIWGQVLSKYTIDRDGTVNIGGLAQGVYFLSFYDPQKGGKRIYAYKVEVLKP